MTGPRIESAYSYEGVAGAMLVRIADGSLILRGTEEVLTGLRDTINRALEDGVAGAHVLALSGVSECIVEVQGVAP